MASCFGLKELQTYIASNQQLEFDQFIEENKSNIVIWSASTNCNSVDHLFFSMWKSRYQKMWNSDSEKGKDTMSKVYIPFSTYKKKKVA
jgi:hypothetical protein